MFLWNAEALRTVCLQGNLAGLLVDTLNSAGTLLPKASGDLLQNVWLTLRSASRALLELVTQFPSMASEGPLRSAARALEPLLLKNELDCPFECALLLQRLKQGMSF